MSWEKTVKALTTFPPQTIGYNPASRGGSPTLAHFSKDRNSHIGGKIVLLKGRHLHIGMQVHPCTCLTMRPISQPGRLADRSPGAGIRICRKPRCMDLILRCIRIEEADLQFSRHRVDIPHFYRYDHGYPRPRLYAADHPHSRKGIILLDFTVRFFRLCTFHPHTF